ncbi:MAG: hypothetical protein A2878_02615 [Candidatus Moranbacteria bacterium RIFCSPHIGHO2_01_FULL_54_31]|nr:MAG: hypothetical protein A2878_02615 [Candidatus Moranbacteria bacterium RIFCSPHIGHO2_01_FULL_54_31]
MAEGEKFDVFTSENKRGMLSGISPRGRWLSVFFVLILAALGGYLLWQRTRTPNQGAPSGSSVSGSVPSETTQAPQTKTVPVTEPVPLFGDANYQSENFRVGDIAIGGEAEFLLTEDTPSPIAISGVRGEAFIEKNKPEVKLVLSWKTNKLAKSEVAYSKGVGQAEKTMSEEDYSLNHSLIIPGLDQASTYVYTIVSTDRFGNQITSDSYAVYTGQKTVSLFDLIAGAVGDVFGWAVSKK